MVKLTCRLMAILVACAALCSQTLQAGDPAIDAAVANAIQRADLKLRALVTHLETTYGGNYSYHFFGSDNAGNISAGTGAWTYGYFSAELWRMYELTPEADTASRDFWRTKASLFSDRVRTVGVQENPPYGDFNNIFQTLEAAWRATGEQKWFDAILDQARAKDTGQFSTKSGVYGYWRTSGRDNVTHWHAFADHTPDVEMMLWAGAHDPDTTFS